jgi:RNA polymerase sigma-70 factor, ECF subfamily
MLHNASPSGVAPRHETVRVIASVATRNRRMAIEMHLSRKGSRELRRGGTFPSGMISCCYISVDRFIGQFVSLQQPEPSGLSEEAKLVARALQADSDAIRLIMERYNRRLYRIARGVVRDDSEAEDVVQEAFGHAFAHLHEYRGEAAIGSWLSRIVLNEAIKHLRRRRRVIPSSTLDDQQGASEAAFATVQLDPERTVAQREIQLLLQRTIDRLPVRFRTVLIMRVIEGMSIRETAETLAIRPETVKTRLHRARAMLRRQLEDDLGPSLVNTFPFEGERCKRIIEKVLSGRNTAGRRAEPTPGRAYFHPRSILVNALGFDRWIKARFR